MKHGSETFLPVTNVGLVETSNCKVSNPSNMPERSLFSTLRHFLLRCFNQPFLYEKLKVKGERFTTFTFVIDSQPKGRLYT